MIFPDSQVRILAYNRIVRDLNGLSKEEFLGDPPAVYRRGNADAPAQRGQWSMYLEENGMGSSSRLILRNRLVSSRVST